MTFFHASQIKGIQVLEPRISNHNLPLIYFSGKRENVLVYLSNAVEKRVKRKIFSIRESGTSGDLMDLHRMAGCNMRNIIRMR